MTLPDNVGSMPTKDLVTLLELHVLEVNILARALILMGVPINFDLVERKDSAYRDGRSEIVLQVGNEPE